MTVHDALTWTTDMPENERRTLVFGKPGPQPMPYVHLDLTFQSRARSHKHDHTYQTAPLGSDWCVVIVADGSITKIASPFASEDEAMARAESWEHD